MTSSVRIASIPYAASLCVVLACSASLNAQTPVASGLRDAPLVARRAPYHPPPLSDFSVLADTGIVSAFAILEKGDMAGFEADLHRQAEAGSAAADLLYGMQFVPLEAFAATGQAGSGAMSIVPLAPDPRPGRPAPSYATALHWLRRASAQGSGQASEVIAQLITRMLGDGLPTTLTLDDAIHYRALAVHQGYDLQAADLRCFRLLPGQGPLACDGAAGSVCPEDATLQTLIAAGLRGHLVPGGGANASYTAATMHPGGPAAHAIVILDHPIAGEQHLPLPRHTTAIYLQQTDGFHTLTPGAPVLDRDIVLRPEADASHSVLGSIEDMNGGLGGSTCLSFSTQTPTSP